MKFEKPELSDKDYNGHFIKKGISPRFTNRTDIEMWIDDVKKRVPADGEERVIIRPKIEEKIPGVPLRTYPRIFPDTKEGYILRRSRQSGATKPEPLDSEAIPALLKMVGCRQDVLGVCIIPDSRSKGR